MAKLTRRRLIRQASIGAGATGVIAVAVATGVHMESASAHTISTNTSKVSQEPVVVFINNPASDTLILMRGENQITVKNAALVKSILSL